ncbi:Virulence sensor protein BvgS [Hydrogenovibrio crunogenus]|uniref:histidine kinase n=2 Tax=Hydrogenovibrio crunogenus TaxID=39765 RepID=A0A4V1C929_9GAMM|nr:Virulence sensor protein BvgS [Hydrogenovibrio crunogenus]
MVKTTSLLKKPFMLILWLFVVLFIVFSSASYLLHQIHLKQAEKHFSDVSSTLLDEQIKKKFDVGQAINLSYANNSQLKKAIAFEDRSFLIKELKHTQQNFSIWTRFKEIGMHIITADGRSLLRTYDIPSYNQDLTRHNLIQKVIKTRKDVSGIDIGGASTNYRLIDIIPVFANDDPEEIVGFISMSQGFESIMNAMNKAGFQFAIYKAIRPDNGGPAEFVQDDNEIYQTQSLKNLSFTEKNLLTNSLHFQNNQVLYTQNLFDNTGKIKATIVVAEPIEILQREAWQNTKNYIIVFAFILIVLLVLSMALLNMMRKEVIKPIQRLEKKIGTIIQTQSFDQEVEVVENNEIGQMKHRFNRLLSEINELIYSINYQQKAIDQTLIVSRTDPYGTILYVNDNFCRISGYSKEELVGQPHNIVRHPEMPKSTFEEVWATIQSKKIWSGEIKNLRKNGETYYVMSYIMPLLDKNGNIKEFLSIREDITERVRLEKSLEKAKQDAEERRLVAEKSNQAKSEFLSSMSHELRTPLNSIIGFAQLLELSDLSEKQKKQLKNISTSGEHLLHLINDLLELAKIESGNISLSVERTELKPIVEECLQMIHTAAEKHHIKILISEKSNCNYFVIADHLRLKQVLVNFLTNAIKYNRENGSVILFAEKKTAEESPHKNGCIRISIEDTGYGIAEKYQKKLFQPFNRLGHETSTIEGTGIGLAITKDLIEKMDGQVGFESTEGVGSTFWFDIPIASDIDSDSLEQCRLKNEEQVENTSIEPKKTGKTTLRILYIEDNPANMQLMANIIETLDNCELVIAPNAEDGTTKAQQYLPNIIFIDINLPGMNGDEALPILKAIPELEAQNTLYYALTANAMKEDVKEGLIKGFDKYLTKPINVAEILSIIKEQTYSL